MNILRYSIIAFSISFFISCANEESKGIDISDFYATYDVSQYNETYVEVYAGFHDGSPIGTSIELSQDDSITVNGIRLTEKETFFGAFQYSKTIYKAVDDIYVFVLTKGGVSYTDSITMPSKLTITDPPNGSRINKGGVRMVYWNGTDNNTSITIRIQAAVPAGYSGDYLTSYPYGDSGSLSMKFPVLSGLTGDVNGTISGYKTFGKSANTIFKKGSSIRAYNYVKSETQIVLHD